MSRKILILTEEQADKIAAKLINEQESNVYTDFDKTWDYKLDNNMWYTSRKGQNKWISLKKAPVAIKKLNRRYKKNAPTGEVQPKPQAVVKKPVTPALEKPTPEDDKDGRKLGDKLSSWREKRANKSRPDRGGITGFLRKLAPNVAQMFFTRPLTGNDFTRKQRSVIYHVIQNAIKRNKKKNLGTTDYADYGEYIKNSFDNRVGASTKDIITKSVTDPYFQVASTLGAFTYQLQPDGTYNVSDTYDFSKGIGYTVKREEIEGLSYLKQLQHVMKKDDLTPYRAARQIAYLEHPDTASPEDKVKINLTINPQEFAADEPSVT